MTEKAKDADMETQFDMEVKNTSEASQEIASRGGRQSAYQPVALKYAEIEKGEAIVLRELAQNDVQNLRNLLYRKFGKRNVIVRSSEQEDGTYTAVVREREGGEYLRS
jgi:hypothetical protein